MAQITDTVRVTSADTWTQVAGASSSGKTAIDGTHIADLDLLITNFDTDANTVLVAETANSTAPSADTDAFTSFILTAQASGGSGHVASLERVQLGVGGHLWIKSDQTDTRILINGYTEASS